MRNIGKGDGLLRGLILGSALAALLILGVNVLGRWERSHRVDGEGIRVVLGLLPRC